MSESEDKKVFLLGKTKSEIEALVQELSLPKFTAQQILEWIYKKRVTQIDQMTNLSVKTREILSERYTAERIKYTDVKISQDKTKKYLFPTEKGSFIEAAFIPDKERYTLCVSSQTGCKMGCLFCATGRQGFQGNLSTFEILNQIFSIDESAKITNLVYMGMGEPFDNFEPVMKSLEILTSSYGLGWSPKRITVSTIGIIPNLVKFLEKSQCHLAISLHSPFEEDRKKLMPIGNVYNLLDVIKILREFEINSQRRISFEYIMFKGINDTLRHVNELARLLNGIKCRINLLKFHPVANVPFESPDIMTIRRFKDALNDKGILTTLRTSRGLDIEAACGLLSTKKLLQKTKEQEVHHKETHK